MRKKRVTQWLRTKIGSVSEGVVARFVRGPWGVRAFRKRNRKGVPNSGMKKLWN